MEDIFNKLQKSGKNNVDNLVKWMSDSKLMEGIKKREQEEKARNMFETVEDIENVDLDKFKTVIMKIAEDQKRNFDELSEQLAQEGPKVVKAAMAGVSAFKDVMKRD